MEGMSRLRGWWLPVAYVVVCVVQANVPLLQTSYWELPVSSLGVVAYWVFYDRVVPLSFDLAAHRWLSTACGFTFFIYLFHEPTLNIVRKLLVLPLGHTSASFALSYLLSPWLFAVLWVFVGLALKRRVPKFYGILTGSR